MLRAKSPMSYDTWCCEHGENLMDVWTYLQNMTHANIYIFDRFRITFPRFCELAYEHSTIPEDWTCAVADDQDEEDREEVIDVQRHDDLR